MITVLLKVTKISFTGFVLVVLCGSVHQTHSSAIAEAAYRAVFPPQQTLMQQAMNKALIGAGIKQQPPTLGQAVYSTVVTPLNATLALGGATYLLYNTGKSYYLREWGIYKNIIKFYNHEVQKQQPTSELEKSLNRLNFLYKLIDKIREINKVVPGTNQAINIDAFMDKLNRSLSLPSYTKIAATLSNDLPNLQSDLLNIKNYIQDQDNMATLKKAAEFYATAKGNLDDFIKLMFSQNTVQYNQGAQQQGQGSYQPQINYQNQSLIDYQSNTSVSPRQLGYQAPTQLMLPSTQESFPLTMPIRSQQKTSISPSLEDDSSAPAQSMIGMIKGAALKWLLSPSAQKQNVPEVD